MNKIFSLFIILLLPSFLLAQSQRYYVDQLAFGQNNGQSWTDAFQDLHDALALAEAGDEIWVAKGTYRASASGNRSASFQLLSGVRLYGGFAGTELDLSERDWTSTPTALDGDIGQPGDSTDNTYNLLYLYRPDSLTLVDGFTFRYAVANDSLASAGEPGASGAALYIMAFDGEAYPTIRHCIFEGNTALQHGGAVYVEGGGSGSIAPLFEQCQFRANRAIRGNGGALYRNGGSWIDRPADVEGCIFEKNSAFQHGGAIFFADSPRSDTFDVCHTILRSNKLTITYDYARHGAAVQVDRARLDGATTLALRNCQITDHNEPQAISTNSAIGLSLFIGVESGNLILDIDSCAFRRNAFSISLETLGWCQLFIDNSSFQKDSLGIACIGVSAQSDSSSMNNVLIEECNHFWINLPSRRISINKCTWRNCSRQNLIGNQTPYSENSTLITNCTIDNSIFGYGDGVPLPTTTVTFSNCLSHGTFHTGIGAPHVGIYNSIFNLAPQSIPFYYLPFGASPGAIFDHNLINLPDTFPNPYGLIKTNNLWSTDPQFMQPDSGDFRLQPCSPAIDAGTNAAVFTATDAAGQPRMQGGTVDMGAYEAPAFGLLAAPTIQPACDSTAQGAIHAPLVGVCAPLTVVWQSGNQSGTTLSNLLPGLYQVTLTDAQGRSLSFAAEVPIGQPPVLYVQGSPISCFGANDGRLTVQPLTGQPPFTYQWSPPVTMDSVATDLPPGPASVTVTDAWGCTAGYAFQVPEPDTLQFTATVQDASGPQSANGSIQVNTVTGGTAPYDYFWSPGGSVADTLGNLSPGLYTLTVTDERGCEAIWTFEVRYVSGTAEAAGKATLLIYPNPAAASTTITGDFQDDMPTVVALYDMAGRLIRTWTLPDGGTAPTWTLPLEGLIKGEYVAQLKNAQGRIVGSGRLIKG